MPDRRQRVASDHRSAGPQWHRPFARSLMLALCLAAGLVAFAVASPAARATRMAPAAHAASPARTYGLGLKVPSNTMRHPARLAGVLATLPVSYSLKQYAPVPGDQGQVGSCAAWGTAYTAMGVLENMDHAQGFWDNPLDLLPGGGGSAMYVYSQTCGGVDNGSYILDNVAVEISQGDDEQSDYTQGESDWRDQPTAQETANARNWVLAAGHDIGTDQYSIEQAISNNEPVVLGIAVTRAFENNTSGNYPDPNNPYDDSHSLGGHAPCAVGYDAGGLIVENSWGPYWDNGGYVHISWAWLEGQSTDSRWPNLNQAVAMVGMSHFAAPAPTPVTPPVTPPVPPPVPAPAVSGFTPTSGPVGTVVTISGSGLTGATYVSFNGVVAAAPVVLSDTQLTATVPAAATSGTVSVTTPGGTATSASSFTVVFTPSLTLTLSGLKSGSLKLGKSVTAGGAVTPTSLAGSQVTLTAQLKKGARWIKAKTFSALIISTGAYRWKFEPAKKGSYRLQATIARTAMHAAATTKWLTFAVK